MASQHEHPARTYRPDPQELTDARPNLPDGTNMNAFLRACLRALHKDPAAMLGAVEKHWPPARPMGRKPKQPDPE